MSPENFTFWLNGYFEILALSKTPNAELTLQQIVCIKDHLALVFQKVTPKRDRVEKRRVKRKAYETPKEDISDILQLDPAFNLDLICTPMKHVDIEESIKKHLDKPKTGAEYWVERTTPTRRSSQKIC